MADLAADFIADFPKDNDLLFVRAFSLGRVLEAPMQHSGSIGKDGTRFMSTIAHRDHVVEVLFKVLVDPFGNMVGDINTDLPHDRHGIRVEPDRMRTGAQDIKLIASQMPEPSFRHLTPAGITGTEKEHFLVHRETPVETEPWSYYMLHTPITSPAPRPIPRRQ